MTAQANTKHYLQSSQKSIPKSPGSALLTGMDLRRSASPTSLFTAKRKLSRDTNGNINKMDSFRIGELNGSICDELEDKHIGLSGFGSVKASISKLDRFVTFTTAAQDNKKLTTQHSFIEGRMNSSLIDNDSTSKLRKKLSGANVSPALEVITRKSQKLLNVIGRDSSISKLGKLSQTLKNNSNMSSGLFEGSNGVAAQAHNNQLKSRNLGSRVINTIKECSLSIYLVQFVRYAPETFSCTNSSSKLRTIDAFLTSRRNSSRESTTFKQKVLMANSNALSPKNSTKAPGLSDSSNAIKRRLYIKDFNTANLGPNTDVADYKRRLESDSAGRDRRQGNTSLLESSEQPLQVSSVPDVGVLRRPNTYGQSGWPEVGRTDGSSPDQSVLIVPVEESAQLLHQELEAGKPIYITSRTDPQLEGPQPYCRTLFPKNGGSLSTDLDYLPSTEMPTTNVSSNGFRDPRLGDIMHSLESFVTQKDQHILQLQCENNRLKMILREHGIPF